MAENAKLHARFKIGKIQVLMDSDREIYELLLLLSVIEGFFVKTVIVHFFRN